MPHAAGACGRPGSSHIALRRKRAVTGRRVARRGVIGHCRECVPSRRQRENTGPCRGAVLSRRGKRRVGTERVRKRLRVRGSRCCGAAKAHLSKSVQRAVAAARCVVKRARVGGFADALTEKEGFG